METRMASSLEHGKDREADRVLLGDVTLRDEHLLARDPRLLADRLGHEVWRSGALPRAACLALAGELELLGVDLIEAGFGNTMEEGTALSAVASRFQQSGPIVSGLVKASGSRDRLQATADAVSCAARGRVHLYIDTDELTREAERQRDAVPRAVERSVAAIELTRRYVEDIEFSPPQVAPEAAEIAAEWARAALAAGARTINIRSGSSDDPTSYRELVRKVRRLVDPAPDIVFSADPFVPGLRGGEALNVATACAEAAMEAGYRQLKCAFHGIAATPGHPSLELLAFQIWLRGRLHGDPSWTGVDTRRLLPASKAVAAAKALDLPPTQPLVGENTSAPSPADFPVDPVERALSAAATRIVLEGLGVQIPGWLTEYEKPDVSMTRRPE
jgi:2-isopropylmalate synthase